MRSMRRISLLALLQFVSVAATAAVGAKNQPTSDGYVFGSVSILTIIPVVGSLTLFMIMVASGAWWQAIATLVIGLSFLVATTFLVPVIGLLVAIGMGPWLLLLAFIVACALSRKTMRANSRVK